METTHVPLPQELRGGTDLAFVGRDVEFETVLDRCQRVAAWRQVVTIDGEAGSGKTRLVRELAGRLVEDGHIVLHGACDPSAPTAYQPVAEALAHLLDHLDDEQLAVVVGGAGDELLRLFPDLTHRLPQLTTPVPASPEVEQHRLRVALTDLLVRASRLATVVLVVEDLHWADSSTLTLLHHLVRSLGDAPVMLVLTARDGEDDTSADVLELRARLARADAVHGVRLGGLTHADVAAMVSDLGGVAPPSDAEDLVRALLELTAGNPFLLGELWRQLVETEVLEPTGEGWSVTASVRAQSSPDRVRSVVAQRLARLAPTTRELLEVAAAIGPTSDLALLRAAVDAPEETVVTALEEAVASGTLEPTDGVTPAYRFTHELVRRAVLDRLNAVAVARVHLRIARSIEEQPRDDARWVRDLATHWTAAAELGHADTAVAACLRAAEVARAQLAFAETADRLTTALALGAPDADRGRLHLRRGEALRAAGAWPAAVEAFTDAAVWARDHGETDVLVEAALGLEDTCWRPGIVDAGATELLTEALRAVSPDDADQRCRMLSALARAHGYRGEAAPAAAARREAVDLARSLGDDRALAGALAQSYWGRGNDDADQVVDALAEAHALAEAAGDGELALYVRAWWMPALGELGRLDEVRAMLGRFRADARGFGQQLFSYHAAQSAAALALAEGRLDEAEERADEALDLSRLGGLTASAAHGIQLFGIRREQGRLAELAPVARMLADRPDGTSLWRPGLAVLLAELDLRDEAHREIARLCADDFAEVPHDPLRIAALTYLAEACWLVDDDVYAALLRTALRPLEGTSLQVAGMVALLGSADRHLGMLASTVGAWDDAERHLVAATVENERQGLVVPAAWSRFAHARMLLARGRPPDAEPAHELLDTVERVAVRHDLAGLRQRIARLRGEDTAVDAHPADLTDREVEVLRLVAAGASNREVGERLFISPNTAANHMRNILSKTGTANRTEAAAFAHGHGLMHDAMTKQGRQA